MGIILDARVRPLRPPDSRDGCRATIQRWIDAMEMYPEVTAAAVGA